MSIVLPSSTVKVLGSVKVGERHPGLQLDKYSDTRWESSEKEVAGQQAQKDAIADVCKAIGDPEAHKYLYCRRDAMLDAFGARKDSMGRFTARTTGPMTLHLSRASALENAGICLHPLYGFVYLPGSGLKGMARAFAETVWLGTQENHGEAWGQIEKIFGWAPGSDRGKEEYKPQDAEKRRGKDVASAGSIIFHDAWPTTWPKLHVDIVNNHHSEYYGAKPEDNAHAPGDWENPIPVYFLAVDKEQVFDFALSVRRDDGNDEVDTGFGKQKLLELAREWLIGALCYMGAGAKTAAGYGCFEPVEAKDNPLSPDAEKTTQSDKEAAASGTGARVRRIWRGALGIGKEHDGKREREVVSDRSKDAKRAEFFCTLELVTPAFLAGANQGKEDCDLRSATLRGCLRWWWRTMHAAYLDVQTLRALEAAIWGDTKQGGAVRVTVKREHALSATLYDYKEMKPDRKNPSVLKPGSTPKLEFKAMHSLEQPSNQHTTRGLHYVSYGMNEWSGGQHKQRWYLRDGAKWSICLSARSTEFFVKRNGDKSNQGVPIHWGDVLKQAQSALWLLCEYGGVGSKARKGFGSLCIINGSLAHALTSCKQDAADLRKVLHLGNSRSGRVPLESASLDECLSETIETKWSDPWFALDQVGYSYQSFTQECKHDESKAALGLPRKIHGPLDQPMKHQISAEHTRPIELKGPHDKNEDREGRHASPLHIHFAKESHGLRVKITAFPVASLPQRSLVESDVSTEFFDESKRFCQAAIDGIRKHIEKRSTKEGPQQALPSSDGLRAKLIDVKREPNHPPVAICELDRPLPNGVVRIEADMGQFNRMRPDSQSILLSKSKDGRYRIEKLLTP